MESIIVLGIDPGTVVTGYGVIRWESGKADTLDYGCIKPPAARKLSERYLIIGQSVGILIDKWKPTHLSVESQYVHRNPQSARKLSMATGIIIFTAKGQNMSIFEYSPSQVKQAVVGNGRAAKQQVQGMVASLLNLTIPSHDAADALALALCHAHTLSKTWCRPNEI